MTTTQTPIEVKAQNKKKRWGREGLKPFFKKAVIVILGLWIIFSLGYIFRDQWTKFQNRQVLIAYQNGVADTIRALISQAELCQPVSLVDGDKRIELIKLGCD